MSAKRVKEGGRTRSTARKGRKWTFRGRGSRSCDALLRPFLRRGVHKGVIFGEAGVGVGVGV